MHSELPYSVLDVFAERAFEGNPLAVIHDARSLSDEQMQTLARETNLSETTFVFPDEDPERDRREGIRVRIFTTQEELPFAGHPTLGTASWLHLHYPPLQGAPEIKLRLNVGPIPVRFDAPPAGSGDGTTGVFATMRQNDPTFGDEHDLGRGGGCSGARGRRISCPGYAPQTVSTGNPFCIVALRSLEALGRLSIPQAEATAWLRSKQTRWFYCIAPVVGDQTSQEESPAVSWRARMQFYGGEDPATGSAAGPCIAWLVEHGLAPSGEPVLLEQGVEILRPSRLSLRATKVVGGVEGIEVAGRTVRVATGLIFLPIHGTFTQRGEP